MDNLNLKIEDFGQINSALININRINLIGGVNGSGKSTASKLLYCFLKAMSQNRDEYIMKCILPDMDSIINRSNKSKKSFSDYSFISKDDFNNILSRYDKAKSIFKNIPEDGIGESIQKIDDFIPMLSDEDNTYYSPVVKSMVKNESLQNFRGNVTIYNDSFKSSIIYSPEDGVRDMEYDVCDDNNVYITEGAFDFITDVLYIDSVSIFDLDYYINTRDSIKTIFNYKEHLTHLLNQLRSDEIPDDIGEDSIKRIDEVNRKISEIIGGETSYSTLFSIGNINEDSYFLNQGDEKFRVNISSGIQQISIIQILLQNRKLIPGTFLIIDEPEVNLHPEWQISFAQILVLLAKELDINLYLNSHSPMFIEAISLYAQYYDLLNETNFYLTQKTDDNKYDFKKINPKNMGAVYENLTKPYDELDKLKAEILFKG